MATGSELSAAEVLLAVVSRGAEVRLTALEVQFRPASLATESEREVLLSGRGRVAPALVWRVEAMRRLLPPKPGPIPLLVVRPGITRHPGACVSCGEPTDATFGRCPLCALAAWL